MHKTHVLIGLAVVALFAMGLSAQAAVPLAGANYASDGNFSLVYDVPTGNLSIEPGHNITTLEIKSAGSLFRATGPKPPSLPGLFDVWSPAKIFKLEPAGFSALAFDAVLPPNMAGDALAADLSIDGSNFPSGPLQGTPNVAAVPEPASITLLALAGLALMGLRRRVR